MESIVVIELFIGIVLVAILSLFTLQDLSVRYLFHPAPFINKDDDENTLDQREPDPIPATDRHLSAMDARRRVGISSLNRAAAALTNRQPERWRIEMTATTHQ